MPQLVDVIIPMYNGSSNVQNIIAELHKQTFKDFRAIFVDDGSKDNTLEVLNEALKTVEFQYLVISKQNGGAGSARNAGMRMAEADYIVFVDNDDGLHEEFIEYMYRAVNESNSDLGICSLQMSVVGDGAVPDERKEFCYKEITPEEAMKHYCKNWFGVYCLIMKRAMQQENNLFFDEECIYNEDAPFIADVIASSSKVAIIDQRLYLYYTHQGSLHRNPSLEKYYSALKSFCDMEKKLSASEKPAARVFNNMGSARFYIATLRRSAVQMKYKEFLELAKIIDFKKYKKQIKNLLLSQRIAAYAVLFSKPVFWVLMKLMFRD